MLCNKIGKAPNAVAMELGFSNATCNKWKNGSIPSSTSVKKIAQYFNVTTDYLLGRDEPSSIKATEHEWDLILNNLSDESLVQLRDYTNYLLWKQDQDVSDSP